MSQPAAKSNQAAKVGLWAPWVGIALVATLAGLILPQMMSGETAVSKPAVAADAKEKSKLEYSVPQMPEPPNFQGMMLRLGAGTVIVLVMCVGTLWGMRRWMAPVNGALSGERTMRLAETLSLGDRCCLHLVMLGNREVLIGVDSGGIKTILPLTKAFDEVLENTDALPFVEESLPGPKLAA